MHPHAELLASLFEFLNAHEHERMADCYHQHASFKDIAFSLHGRDRIHAMWEMFCTDNEHGKSDISVTVEELEANDSTGWARIVDNYTIRDSKRVPKPRVRNPITSSFEFRDGLILVQKDDCDRVTWAKQAFGGVEGFVMGHCGIIRRCGAMSKLKRFIAHRDKPSG